ncbi:helix-turn-helix transcriptional regulator [Clostridium botulinum]|uniref:helix-turn-helix transcriptional regulator n=1 Tax=Clostridium botulinum TaxID=1491 RepID=UPI003DA2C3E5
MNKIDSLRKKKCLSYGAIAKEAELTPTYIYLLAKGKRTNPSLEVMQRIARTLDTSVEKLFDLN